MQEKREKIRGFTLIEVVVVIAIIGIMSAMVMVSLTTGRTTRDLDRSAREVVAVLRDAQNAAVSGRAANVNENNCAYSVQISGSAYTVSNSYGNGCASTGVLATYTLSRGVVFGSNLTASFSVPRGELTTGAASITLSKGGSTVYVCLSAAGRITENGSNSTCP